ncbi:hypothetical protein [Microbacterium sp.]|uniref:hypothetical protein n=1 Tax=Microbacterium sp. TaxID=51671 RepID=UPI0039E3A267
MLRLAHHRRTAIVVTVHNLTPHESLPRGARRCLKALDRSIDRWILLNGSETLPLPAERVSVIPHGSYRSLIAHRVFPAPHPEALLYFGVIRAYKNVPQLVRAYAQTSLSDEAVTLRVIGAPWDEDQRQAVESAVQDARATASFRLEALRETELHREILDAGLIVLPYRRMYNSGAVILALSLDRPVLVPDCAATRELQREFGETWVITYSGDLDAATLEDGYRRYLAGAPARRPLGLGDRDWAVLGLRYVEVYESAISDRLA